MKIGIIIGSIRDGRKGGDVANWVHELASQRGDAEYEIIDLRQFDVPPLTAEVLPAMADRQYDDDRVTRWSQAIDACDGYVFVTPEYNHGVPGALKNAVDTLASEWTGKTVAFVSYGADGGVRATEQWRQILANFNMYDIRTAVAMNIFTEFSEDGQFRPLDRRAGEIDKLLTDLVATTRRWDAAV